MDRSEILDLAIKDDWTLGQIAGAIGVTKERARQLLCERGFKTTDRTRPTVTSIARILSCSSKRVSRRADELGLGYYRGTRRHFTKDEVAILTVSLDADCDRQCQVCGESISYTRGSPPRYCSSKCFNKTPATVDNTDKWSRLCELFDADAPVGEWLFIGEAAKLGLTKMQVVYLGWKGLVRTCEVSGNGRWAVMTKYSSHDVKLAVLSLEG